MGVLRPIALVLALAGALVTAAPAAAQSVVLQPDTLDSREPGFVITPRAALRTAERLAAVRAERAERPGLRAKLVVPLYFGDRRYEVVYREGGKVRVDVHVDGRSGRVLEVWTGYKADTLLARGYSPPIGRSLNEPYVWLPLALLFLAPFVDLRRPLRLLHLDLLVVLAFGVSQIFFNRGELELSVPLTYPLLAYLLVRLLLAGLRPRSAPGPLVPHLPMAAVACGLVALVVFRVLITAADFHVVDVGQESVFGADRIQTGASLYREGDDNPDTYGPLTYLAYVPFELIWPVDGPGGYRNAARAAALTFDLLMLAALTLLGARLRRGRDGRNLGLCLAYAWAACPFTLYALMASTNDVLVALLVVAALLAVSSAPARGLLIGLGAAAKFAPLALVPLMAAGTGRRSRRELLAFAAGLAGAALLVVAYLPEGGIGRLWDVTLGHQLGRDSPFSIWGLHPSLGWLQTLVNLAALGLALTLAFVPRERDLRQLTALAGAVLIALQLAATYWFYFYLVWFLPMVFAATFAAHQSARRPQAYTGA
jgi:Glycosyltransferase family 87